MQTILTTINSYLDKRRNAQLSDAEKFKALMTRAGSNGDLPAKDAAELIALGERIGLDTDAIESKLQAVITANAEYRNLRDVMSKLPEANAAFERAKREADEAAANLEAAKRAKVEADQAYTRASVEVDIITGNREAFRSLIVTSGDLLPTLTNQDRYFCSNDFMLRRAPSGEYPDPREPTRIDYDSIPVQPAPIHPMEHIRYATDRLGNVLRAE